MKIQPLITYTKFKKMPDFRKPIEKRLKDGEVYRVYTNNYCSDCFHRLIQNFHLLLAAIRY